MVIPASPAPPLVGYVPMDEAVAHVRRLVETHGNVNRAAWAYAYQHHIHLDAALSLFYDLLHGRRKGSVQPRTLQRLRESR